MQKSVYNARLASKVLSFQTVMNMTQCHCVVSVILVFCTMCWLT